VVKTFGHMGSVGTLARCLDSPLRSQERAIQAIRIRIFHPVVSCILRRPTGDKQPNHFRKIFFWLSRRDGGLELVWGLNGVILPNAALTKHRQIGVARYTFYQRYDKSTFKATGASSAPSFGASAGSILPATLRMRTPRIGSSPSYLTTTSRTVCETFCQL